MWSISDKPADHLELGPNCPDDAECPDCAECHTCQYSSEEP